MEGSALFSCGDAVSTADCAWMISYRMRNGPDTTKLYKAAEMRLYDYLLPSQTATGDGLPTVVRDYILDVISCKQIGNSVPPLFAYAIAREAMSCL